MRLHLLIHTEQRNDVFALILENGIGHTPSNRNLFFIPAEEICIKAFGGLLDRLKCFPSRRRCRARILLAGTWYSLHEFPFLMEVRNPPVCTSYRALVSRHYGQTACRKCAGKRVVRRHDPPKRTGKSMDSQRLVEKQAVPICHPDSLARNRTVPSYS